MPASPPLVDLIACVWARRHTWVTDQALESAARQWQQEPEQSLLQLLAEHARLSAGQLAELRQVAATEAVRTGSGRDASLLGELPAVVRQLLRGLPGEELTTPHDQAFDTRPSDPPVSSSVREIVPVTDHRFQIIRLHAQGGLGAVYVANDCQLDRTVALKQIKSQWADDEQSRARFLLEAKVTGRLEHPGIVPIYALGTDEGGRPFYAMRFIRGESLLAVIERFHAPQATAARTRTERLGELRRLLARFVEVCHALQFAHSRGIIHRDVKPANIMLGKYGETLLVDWGLAKVMGDDAQIDVETDTDWSSDADISGTSSGTQMGAVIGTPAYMSPEQAAGRLDELGPESDVFSLGVSLFQVLTGKLPRDDQQDLGVLMAQITSGRIRSPRSLAPWIPRPLSAICLKALAPDPHQRYPAAGALGEELQRWLADEPVAAHQESWTERSFRWMRSHRTLVISAVVAQAVAAVGVVVGSIGWNHLQHLQRQQQQQLAQQQLTRTAELRSSAQAAEQSAQAEIRAGRFTAAVALLDPALQSIAKDPQFSALHERLAAQRARVGRLVDYHVRGTAAEELTFFQHDTEAHIALFDALEILGVFQHADWWAHLPTEDLSPAQRDELQWDVYRKLTLLASVYSKNVVRHMLAPKGATAAQEVLAVDQWVQRFRTTQSTRFHAGVARMRLGKGLAPSALQLDQPDNPADAYLMGALWVIADQNPAVAAFFSRGTPHPIAQAKRQLALVEALDPTDYWSHFLLGFIELLQAGDPWKTPLDQSRPHYRQARAALGHAISIDPLYWLAYAERSGASRQEIEARRHHAAAEEASAPKPGNPRDEALVDQVPTAVLKQWMIHDAQRAADLAGTRAEVQWYVAFAQQTAGKSEAAIDALLEAVQLGMRFDVETIPRMVDPELQRALPEAIQIADAQIAAQEDSPRLRTLRGAALWRLRQSDPALDDIERALQADAPPPFAHAVRGQIALADRQFQLARTHFRRALDGTPRDAVALIGMARCDEEEAAYPAALGRYNTALESAVTAYQRAACELGKSRTLLRMGRLPEALAAAAAAQQHKPSCELDSLHRVATQTGNTQFVRQLKQQQKPRSLVALLAGGIASPHSLPLLNRSFELSLARHWNNDNLGATAWHNQGGCRSTAQTEPGEAHSQTQALHILFPPDSAGQGYGITTQTLPAAAATRYRITLWARTNNLTPRGLQLVLDDRFDSPVVALPGGTSRWQSFTGEFETSAGGSPAGLVPITVKIMAVAPGEVWLDDLQIERVGTTGDESELTR